MKEAWYTQKGFLFWVGTVLHAISALLWFVLVFYVAIRYMEIGEVDVVTFIGLGFAFTAIPIGIGIACRMPWSASVAKSPWGGRTLFTVSVFGGWLTGSIIAGLNWRRMGRKDLMWPTIIVPVIIFLIWMCVPWLKAPYQIVSTSSLAGLIVAGGLWLWQKDSRRTWQQSHPLAKEAGRQIPLLITIVSIAFFLGLILTG
ncbi:hypothetical protein ACFLVG_00675 [Chloroflexota bacterium]